MLMSLISSVDASAFAELFSPAFFRVLPARVVADQVRTLHRHYRDEAFGAQARSMRRASLQSARLNVKLQDRPSGPADGTRPATAATVLEVYFHQILMPGPMCLDFRPQAFSELDGVTLWHPKPLWCGVEESFRRALADMYEGFYTDQPAVFTRGCDAVGLRAVEPTLRRQFGDGDQTSVRFELAAFHRRFLDVFAGCKQAGLSLHPGFISLGVALASLYQHLETLGGAHNVRAAYLSARFAAQEALAADSGTSDRTGPKWHAAI